MLNDQDHYFWLFYGKSRETAYFQRFPSLSVVRALVFSTQIQLVPCFQPEVLFRTFPLTWCYALKMLFSRISVKISTEISPKLPLYWNLTFSRASEEGPQLDAQVVDEASASVHNGTALHRLMFTYNFSNTPPSISGVLDNKIACQFTC